MDTNSAGNGDKSKSTSIADFAGNAGNEFPSHAWNNQCKKSDNVYRNESEGIPLPAIPANAEVDHDSDNSSLPARSSLEDMIRAGERNAEEKEAHFNVVAEKHVLTQPSQVEQRKAPVAVKLRFLASLSEFVIENLEKPGTTKIGGPFKAGDLAKLSDLNSRGLIAKGKAEEVALHQIAVRFEEDVADAGIKKDEVVALQFDDAADILAWDDPPAAVEIPCGQCSIALDSAPPVMINVTHIGSTKA